MTGSPEVGDFVRVLREYPPQDRQHGRLDGALGVVSAVTYKETFPYELMVGVVKRPEDEDDRVGFWDLCHEVEVIDEDTYLREYTVTRLEGRHALNPDEIRELAKEK